MELNGNLLSEEFYKFNENTIVNLNEEDYKQIINNKKIIKIQFPYGINGIMSDIYEYTFNEFNIGNLINIIKEFYNSQLTKIETEQISKEAEIDIDNFKFKKDILRLTNQCFIEELEYKNEIFIFLLKNLNIKMKYLF